MKYIKLFIWMVSVALFAACSEDSLDSKSVFDSNSHQEVKTEFDNWLNTNFVDTYNIRFNYRYIDKETDNYYNLAPAEVTKAKALAIMMKHIWLDAYSEVIGEDFMKTYAPRVMQLVGSAAYNSQSSIVMGTAEGGLKVTLYNVNIIDPAHPVIDADEPYVDNSQGTYDLNFWFFHTMNHEFCHILTQKKNYSTDFQTVSAGKYQTEGWVNMRDPEAPKYGFVSGYATKEYNEDFAEIFAQYVTHSEKAWQKILQAGIIYKTDDEGNVVVDMDGYPVIEDQSGYDAIMAKFNILKEYFSNTWGFDITQLRNVILRRSEEVKSMDLSTLK